MANGASTGFVTGAVGGAVSGAAIGTMITPVIGTAIGAVIGGVAGGVAGYFSGSSSDASMASSASWANYNAQMQQNIDRSNANNQLMLTGMNAILAKNQASDQAELALDTAAYNISMIKATTDYNDDLMEQELSLMWESADLDLTLMENQRAVERGGIVANQSVSGTTIGLGSNADVVVSQKTQEALDATVVRHGADIQAAKISDARAQSVWQGEVAMREAAWQGEMGAWSAQTNANTQAISSLASAALGNSAAMTSSDYRYSSAVQGVSNAQDTHATQNDQALVSGLFSAAEKAASYSASYYAGKGTGDSLIGNSSTNTEIGGIGGK